MTEPDGTPGQWYLHLFAPAQPDLNWDHPGVRADMADMLRFWFDFGLDGLRMDAASGLAKEPGLPDFGFLADDLFMPVTWEGAPLWDVEGVHDILREWRAIADSYPGDRYYIGEVVVNGAERLARYMRPDELHTTFNLDFLKSPLEPERLRRTIDDTLAAFASVGAPPTWTLSNHDETRHVTRYGRAWTGVPLPPPWPFPEIDSRSAPGGPGRCCSCCSPCRARCSSTRARSSACGRSRTCPTSTSTTRSGRARGTGSAAGTAAGCRSPGPATSRRSASPRARPGCPSRRRGGTTPPRRRSSSRTRCWPTTGPPWPPGVRSPPSMAPTITWLGGPDGVLAFSRGNFACTVNLSDQPVPAVGPVLLSSAPVVDGVVPPEVAVWTSGLPGADQAAQHAVHEGR